MKKKQLTYLALAGAMALMACGSLLCGNSIVSYEDVTGKTQASAVEIAPMGYCDPDTPEVLLQENPYLSSPLFTAQTYYETYNCFVAYPIKNVDAHASRLTFSSDMFHDAYKVDDVDRNEVIYYIATPAFASGTNLCHPNLYYVKSECLECGSHSATNRVMFDDKNKAYNAYCLYPTTHAKTYGEISTTPSDECSLEHYGNIGQFVCFSIACNRDVGGVGMEASLEVPEKGQNETTLVVGGVTFYVRVTRTKVEFRASEKVECNGYDTMFVFSTVDEADLEQTIE